MRSRWTAVFVILAAVGAGTALAAPIAKRESIRVDRPALIGDTVIAPGTYQLEVIPGLDAVRLVQGKRTVTEVRCTVGLGEPVYPGVAIHYRSGGDGPDRLVKIEFADSKLAIQFPTDATGKTDTPIAKAADRP